MVPGNPKRSRSVSLTPEAIELLTGAIETKWRLTEGDKKLTRKHRAHLMDLSVATAHKILDGVPVDRASALTAFRSLELQCSKKYLISCSHSEPISEIADDLLPDSPIESEQAPQRQPTSLTARRSFALLLTLVVIIGLGAAFLWPVRSSNVASDHSSSIESRTDQLSGLSLQDLTTQILRTDQNDVTSAGVDARNRRRCDLVVELSKRCWDAMWKKEEPEFVEATTAVHAQITSAFQWALTHDTHAALSIIGNGHRVFMLADPLKASWHGMALRALHSRQASDPISEEEGRANLAVVTGYVFSIMNVNGMPFARRAIDIFTALGGHDADLSNAYRHMGMCFVESDQVDERRNRMACYGPAISFSSGLESDPRWLAQAYLSVGEGPYGTMEDVAECMNDTVKSLALIEKTGSEKIIHEELTTLCSLIVLNPKGHEGLYSQTRHVFEEASNSASARQVWDDWVLYRVSILNIDCQLGRKDVLCDDLESLLFEKFVPLKAEPAAELARYYQALCRILHRKARPYYPDWVITKELDKVNSWKPGGEKEMIDVAYRLTRADPPAFQPLRADPPKFQSPS